MMKSWLPCTWEGCVKCDKVYDYHGHEKNGVEYDEVYDYLAHEEDGVEYDEEHDEVLEGWGGD